MCPVLLVTIAIVSSTLGLVLSAEKDYIEHCENRRSYIAALKLTVSPPGVQPAGHTGRDRRQ